MACLECDFLQVSVGAGRFQSELFKFARDILDGFAIAIGADIPAFELVIGEELDVRPPARALLGDVDRAQESGCG